MTPRLSVLLYAIAIILGGLVVPLIFIWMLIVTQRILKAVGDHLRKAENHEDDPR